MSPAPAVAPEIAAPGSARMRAALVGLGRLLIGLGGLVAVLGGYRFLVHPAISKAFALGESAAGLVRRTGIFVLVVAFYAVFVRISEKRAVRELGIRWRWTLLAGLAGALTIGLTIAVGYATGHYVSLSYRGFAATGDVFQQIGIAAVLEEIAFRAILFRVLEETFGLRPALVVSALVFCAAHVANGGFGVAGLLSVTLGGLMWAGVFVLSRNLWVTAAHHACWNATIFCTGLPLSGEEGWRARAPWASRFQGSALWTGGAFGPENSVVNLAVSFAVCLGLWWLVVRARRRGAEVDAGAALRRP